MAVGVLPTFGDMGAYRLAKLSPRWPHWTLLDDAGCWPRRRARRRMLLPGHGKLDDYAAMMIDRSYHTATLLLNGKVAGDRGFEPDGTKRSADNQRRVVRSHQRT